MTRQDIINEAKSWLGTPYHHMGKVKGVGVDCGQLLLGVYFNVGLIPEIDVGQYPNDWHFHRDDEQYLKRMNKYCRPTSNPKPGDIVLFKFGRCISHGAILIEDDIVIHSYIRVGCVYTSLKDAELVGRVAGYFTLMDD